MKNHKLITDATSKPTCNTKLQCRLKAQCAIYTSFNEDSSDLVTNDSLATAFEIDSLEESNQNIEISPSSYVDTFPNNQLNIDKEIISSSVNTIQNMKLIRNPHDHKRIMSRNKSISPDKYIWPHTPQKHVKRYLSLNDRPPFYPAGSNQRLVSGSDSNIYRLQRARKLYRSPSSRKLLGPIRKPLPRSASTSNLLTKNKTPIHAPIMTDSENFRQRPSLIRLKNSKNKQKKNSNFNASNKNLRRFESEPNLSSFLKIMEMLRDEKNFMKYDQQSNRNIDSIKQNNLSFRCQNHVKETKLCVLPFKDKNQSYNLQYQCNLNISNDAVPDSKIQRCKLNDIMPLDAEKQFCLNRTYRLKNISKLNPQCVSLIEKNKNTVNLDRLPIFKSVPLQQSVVPKDVPKASMHALRVTTASEDERFISPSMFPMHSKVLLNVENGVHGNTKGKIYSVQNFRPDKQSKPLDVKLNHICNVCGKHVSTVERLELLTDTYHKTCFHCSVCSSNLLNTKSIFFQQNWICFKHGIINDLSVANT